MDLVILHYHLNRGGVTRVIENHLRMFACLPEDCRPQRVLIAYGGRAADWHQTEISRLPLAIKLAVIPELEYDQERMSSPSDLTRALEDHLDATGCQRSSTVIHAHNHALGKNANLPVSLVRLARHGWKLLLHVHDFAEDLRPQNYRHMLERAGSRTRLQSQLYPQADHIHYAVLNRRDYNILESSGVAPQRLELLPNPMDLGQAPCSEAQSQLAKQKLADAVGVPVGRPYVLYPVRAIRRKNLGELLLWSAAVPQATFGVTLAPMNPSERAVYESWVEHAHLLGLPVEFNVGSRVSLAENYSAADAIITTSLTEGFGLVYLEAVLAERPLIGRSLPGVTDDFIQAGMRFPGLASRIEIPQEWVDVDDLAKTYSELARDLATSFGMRFDFQQLEETVERSLQAATIDFGRLDSKSQRAVIRRVSLEPADRQRLLALNPTMRCPFSQPVDARATMQANRKVIERHYALDVIGRQLLSRYDKLLSCDASEVRSDSRVAASVLSIFARPDRILPVRLEA